MTSRPAAPESKTPETDALIEDMLHGAGIPRCDEWDRLLANAKKFERQHSLAQTEIKGHMRIKDDLERRLAENLRDMAQLADRENEDFREVRIKLAKAQSRIAELEKALEDAAAALHNDFEPDNQPRAYHAARRHLK